MNSNNTLLLLLVAGVALYLILRNQPAGQPTTVQLPAAQTGAVSVALAGGGTVSVLTNPLAGATNVAGTPYVPPASKGGGGTSSGMPAIGPGVNVVAPDIWADPTGSTDISGRYQPRTGPALEI